MIALVINLVSKLVKGHEVVEEGIKCYQCSNLLVVCKIFVKQLLLGNRSEEVVKEMYARKLL